MESGKRAEHLACERKVVRGERACGRHGPEDLPLCVVGRLEKVLPKDGTCNCTDISGTGFRNRLVSNDPCAGWVYRLPSPSAYLLAVNT